MSFNLQAVTGWLSVPVQTVATTFLPTLGGKKETHFRRVLVDQFSKFQKMSSLMNPQNQLLSMQNCFGTFCVFSLTLLCCMTNDVWRSAEQDSSPGSLTYMGVRWLASRSLVSSFGSGETIPCFHLAVCNEVMIDLLQRSCPLGQHIHSSSQ